jgi:asparagine synthase (glutamine-hydrolysing)
MARCVAHRGPDGEGLWTSPSGRAVFAHRRLSVIDLGGGAQPMVDPATGTAIVFNGEIYNYRELRRGMVQRGAQFATQSDTEVLLRLVAERGAGAVADLRGMFAFAAWDDAGGRLLLARDRVGKKPLFHRVDADGCLYFASTLQALRDAVPGGDLGPLDLEALDQYFTLGYVPAPRTIHRGVGKLPAGHTATLGAGAAGGGLAVAPFWDLAADPGPAGGPPARGFDEAVDELEALLDEAVALRLRSDVPLGVFLSGGVDSSLVTALAARQVRGLATFSIGFDDALPGYDESEHAAAVARHLGTEHRLFRVRSDLFDLLPDVVRHFGEPYADSSALPTWVLSRETRQHVTVALGGDGGDEGFAGYHWYRTAARVEAVGRWVPAGAAAAGSRALAPYAAAAAGRLPGGRRVGQLQRGLGMLAHGAAAARFAALRSVFAPGDAQGLYAGALAETRRTRGDSGLRLLRDAYARCQGPALRRMRYTDVRTYLADELMPKVDVASMAHGLEVRAPLLDHEVLAFGLRQPDAHLFDAAGGKRLLRTLLHRHVPAALFDRPKQGFSVPLRRWFLGPLRARAAALADGSRLLDSGLFRPAGLRALVAEHAAGTRDHSQRLFALLVLDAWLDR